jgi:hypothetical protein
MSNMNLGTCNLPNLQTVCAQRFPNTVVKIVVHLDWQHLSHFRGHGGGAQTKQKKKKDVKGEQMVVVR